jgi:hypothetical protein
VLHSVAFVVTQETGHVEPSSSAALTDYLQPVTSTTVVALTQHSFFPNERACALGRGNHDASAGYEWHLGHL